MQTPSLLSVIRAKDSRPVTPNQKPNIVNALLDVVRPPKPANVSLISAKDKLAQSIDKSAPEYAKLKEQVKAKGAAELIKAGRRHYGRLLVSGKYSKEELKEFKKVMSKSEELIGEAAKDLQNSTHIHKHIALCMQIR